MSKPMFIKKYGMDLDSLPKTFDAQGVTVYPQRESDDGSHISIFNQELLQECFEDNISTTEMVEIVDKNGNLVFNGSFEELCNKLKKINDMRSFLIFIIALLIIICIITPCAINFNQVKSNQEVIIQKLDSIQQECINIQNDKPIIHCNCGDSNKTDTVTKYIYIK